MAIALLTLFFGATALWFARHVSAAMRNRGGWPTAPGTFLERGIGGPEEIGRVYRPHVKYAYSVAGRDYTNDQFFLIGSTHSRMSDPIRRLVENLPDPVPVHYDPDDPARSYLVVNPAWHSWLPRVFGVFALLLGSMQLLVAVMGKP